MDDFSDDIGEWSVNFSWSPLPIAANKIYNMLVKNGNNYVESFQSYESYYILVHCSILKVPHPVRSTTSLSLSLMLVLPTLALVAVYPAQ